MWQRQHQACHWKSGGQFGMVPPSGFSSSRRQVTMPRAVASEAPPSALGGLGLAAARTFLRAPTQKGWIGTYTCNAACNVCTLYMEMAGGHLVGSLVKNPRVTGVSHPCRTC